MYMYFFFHSSPSVLNAVIGPLHIGLMVVALAAFGYILFQERKKLLQENKELLQQLLDHIKGDFFFDHSESRQAIQDWEEKLEKKMLNKSFQDREQEAIKEAMIYPALHLPPNEAVAPLAKARDEAYKWAATAQLEEAHADYIQEYGQDELQAISQYSEESLSEELQAAYKKLLLFFEEKITAHYEDDYRELHFHVQQDQSILNTLLSNYRKIRETEAYWQEIKASFQQAELMQLGKLSSLLEAFQRLLQGRTLHLKPKQSQILKNWFHKALSIGPLRKSVYAAVERFEIKQQLTGEVRHFETTETQDDIIEPTRYEEAVNYMRDLIENPHAHLPYDFEALEEKLSNFYTKILNVPYRWDNILGRVDKATKLTLVEHHSHFDRLWEAAKNGEETEKQENLDLIYREHYLSLAKIVRLVTSSRVSIRVSSSGGTDNWDDDDFSSSSTYLSSGGYSDDDWDSNDNDSWDSDDSWDDDGSSDDGDAWDSDDFGDGDFGGGGSSSSWDDDDDDD